MFTKLEDVKNALSPMLKKTSETKWELLHLETHKTIGLIEKIKEDEEDNPLYHAKLTAFGGNVSKKCTGLITAVQYLLGEYDKISIDKDKRKRLKITASQDNRGLDN